VLGGFKQTANFNWEEIKEGLGNSKNVPVPLLFHAFPAFLACFLLFLTVTVVLVVLIVILALSHLAAKSFIAGLPDHFNQGWLSIETFSSQSKEIKKLSKWKKEKGWLKKDSTESWPRLK